MAGQARAQGRVGTWRRPGTAGATPWLIPLAGLAGPLAAKLREWAAMEVAPGRLMPWLPVAFGTGIALYFTAEREPVWWWGARPARGPLRARFFGRGPPPFLSPPGGAGAPGGVLPPPPTPPPRQPTRFRAPR